MSKTVTTLARRKSLAKLTSGRIATLPPIKYIALGDGGVDTNGNPKQPEEIATALYHEIFRHEVGMMSFPTETSVRYSLEIGESELVGKEISEIGLLDADGTLCAIKTMYTKRKDEGISFTFEFDDEF